MGQACDFSNNPYDSFFTSLWLKEEGGLWKLWSSGACKLPRSVGLQKQKCVRVLAGSRNYYIKYLRKIRKRIPFIIHRFQPPYATTLTL
jgi:hypothetical protein